MSGLSFSGVRKDDGYWCLTIRESGEVVEAKRRIARVTRPARYSPLPIAKTKREANIVRDDFVQAYSRERMPSRGGVGLLDFIEKDMDRVRRKP